MRIITVNLNGIRAAAKKGFFTWLNNQQADVICIQETKAQTQQLTNNIFHPEEYYAYFVAASKPGYSGVAIYSKKQPINICQTLGWQHADQEGRYLQFDFSNISIASIYLPSGTSGEARQSIKYDFMARYFKVLKQQLKNKRHYIICGDFNIAHKNIDLKNWRNNQNSSGFLPEERAWLDLVFTKLGYIDSFRYKYPTKEQYTWWSNRANAWENNVGWRLDYQLITPKLATTILDAKVYRQEKFSDHAPYIVDYAMDLV